MKEAKSTEDFIEGSGYKFTKVELAKMTTALHKMGIYAKQDASKQLVLRDLIKHLFKRTEWNF